MDGCRIRNNVSNTFRIYEIHPFFGNDELSRFAKNAMVNQFVDVIGSLSKRESFVAKSGDFRDQQFRLTYQCSEIRAFLVELGDFLKRITVSFQKRFQTDSNAIFRCVNCRISTRMVRGSKGPTEYLFRSTVIKIRNVALGKQVR